MYVVPSGILANAVFQIYATLHGLYEDTVSEQNTVSQVPTADVMAQKATCISLAVMYEHPD
jgi:hypothetical protein